MVGGATLDGGGDDPRAVCSASSFSCDSTSLIFMAVSCRTSDSTLSRRYFLASLLGQAEIFSRTSIWLLLMRLTFHSGGGDGPVFGQVVLFSARRRPFSYPGILPLLQAAFLLGKLAAALFDFLFRTRCAIYGFRPLPPAAFPFFCSRRRGWPR